MKLLLMLLKLAVVSAGDYGRCKGIIYSGKHYDETVLKTKVSFPSHLTTDYTTNTLYFLYKHYGALAIATLNLDTLEFHSAELMDVYEISAAIDVESKAIYLGTWSGVHKYDIINNKLNPYAVGNTPIASLFLNNGVLYFTEFKSNALYTIENGVVTLFPDLKHTRVLNFYIDKDDDMYFINDTGLYRQQKGTNYAVYYEGSNHIDWIEGLTADKNGKVFLCLKNGIYAVDKQINRLVKQMPVYMPNSLAFDQHNNVIYANISDIVRVSLSTDQICMANVF